MFWRYHRALLALTAIFAVAPNFAYADDWSGCTELLTGEAPQNVSALAQSGANGQQVTCNILNRQAQNASLFSFDYSVPQSPALMLAGLSTDKVTPATSLKPFVLSLPSLLGDGSSVNSAAADFSPAWALSDDEHTNAFAYIDNSKIDYWDRLWYRARIGIAVTKGDDGGGDPTQAKPSRAALGVSLSLTSDSDPVWARLGSDEKNTSHWINCLHNNLSSLIPYTPEKGGQFDKINNAILALQSLSGDTNSWHGTVPNPKKNALLTTTEQDADQILGRGTPWSYSATWDSPQQRDAEITSEIAALHKKKADIVTSPAWTAADAKAIEITKTCAQEASSIAQHAPDLKIGAGVVWQGPSGGDNWTDFSAPNAAVWIAGRLPLDFGNDVCEQSTDPHASRSELACWTIGGSGRYSAGEMDATGDTTTPMFKANVAEGWVGVERVNSTMKLGGYFGYMDQSAVNAADKAFSKSGTRWLFSGAYSLSNLVNGLWVVGSYGNANGSTTTLNDKVALLSLTFGPPSLSSGFVTKSGSSGDSSSGASQSTTSTATSPGP